MNLSARTVGLVAAVCLVGQTLEGYVLTPRLVGGNVGLHPVWVMFALLAGGRLFGFVGVLIALPIAAVIGVLLRFALARYLASPFYYGAPEEPAGTPPAIIEQWNRHANAALQKPAVRKRILVDNPARLYGFK